MIKIGVMCCVVFSLIAAKIRKEIKDVDEFYQLSAMKRLIIRLLILLIALCFGFVFSFLIISLNNMFNVYR